MKVRLFRAPRVLVATVAEARTILRGAWSLACAQNGSALLYFAAALLGAWLVWPHDRAILNEIHALCGTQDAEARNVSAWLGTWGDYDTYNVPIALLIWLYGTATESRWWRRVALVAFLGATLGGLLDDCLRLTLGRPRPDAHMPDGFYGIARSLHGGFQSFPSGHAAADFGMAFALLTVDLPLGLLALVFACIVIWARMELERHYPSDVLVGSAIGLYAGLVIGRGARRRRPDSHQAIR